jgi:hypothetical protein
MAYAWMSNNSDNAQRAAAISGAFAQGLDRKMRQKELDARLKEQQLQQEREKILFPLRERELDLRAQTAANQLQATAITLRGAKDEEAQYGQEIAPLGDYVKSLAMKTPEEIDKAQPPLFRSLKARQQAQSAYELARNTTAAKLYQDKEQEAGRLEARAQSDANVAKAAMKVDPGFREFAIVNGVKNPDELDAFAVNELKTRYDKQVAKKTEMESLREKQKLETGGRIEVEKLRGENAIKKIEASVEANADKISDLNTRTMYKEMMANARTAQRNFDEEGARRWQQRAEEVFAQSTMGKPSQETSAASPASKYEEGKIYRDGSGRKARYENGKFVPIP